MTVSFMVLIGLVAWTLALLILMEAMRGMLVMNKTVPSNNPAPKPEDS